MKPVPDKFEFSNVLADPGPYLGVLSAIMIDCFQTTLDLEVTMTGSS